MAQVSSIQTSTSKISPTEGCTLQCGEAQVGIAQIGAIQVHLAQIGPLQGRAVEVRITEISMDKICVCETTPLTASMLQKPFHHGMVRRLGACCGHHDGQAQDEGSVHGDVSVLVCVVSVDGVTVD